MNAGRRGPAAWIERFFGPAPQQGMVACRIAFQPTTPSMTSVLPSGSGNVRSASRMMKTGWLRNVTLPSRSSRSHPRNRLRRILTVHSTPPCRNR